MSNLIKDFIKLSSAEIFAKCFSFLAFVFYVKYLHREELAFIAYYEMLGAMSTLFFGFGILPSFIRELPGKLNNNVLDAQKMINTGQIILLPGILLFATIIFMFSSDIAVILTHNKSYTLLFKIISLGILFSGWKKINLHLLWSNSSFGKMSIIKTFEPILKHLLSIPLLLIYGMNGLLFGFVIKDLIATIITISFLKQIILKFNSGFSSAKTLIKDSIPYYLEGYLIYFRSQGDNWIISTYLGQNAIAIYYVAKKLYSLLNLTLEAADKIFTSHLAKEKNNHYQLTYKINDIQNNIVTYAIPAFSFIIGLIPIFIILIAGDKYISSIIPCIILCFTVFINLLFIIYKRGVFISMLPKVRFKITLFETICLLLCLFLFTPMLGSAGVATSRALSAFLVGVLTIFILHTKIHIHLKYRNILKSTSIFVIVTSILLYLQYYNLSPVSILIYIPISIILFLFFSFFIKPPYILEIQKMFKLK